MAPALEAHLPACEACRVELEELCRALAMADAELQSLLSAAPSPELAARIRTAVSEAPVASSWRPGFWLALAGAAAALLVAVGLLAQRDQQAPSTTAAMEAQRAADAVEKPTSTGEGTRPEATAAVTSANPQASASRLAPFRASARSPRPTAARAPAAEPEVLVPAGAAEALLRFAASVQRRNVAPGSLLVADLNAPLAESSDLAIRPIELVALDPEEDTGAE